MLQPDLWQTSILGNSGQVKLDCRGMKDVNILNTTGEAGGGMRAFFIFVLFVLAFLLFANSSMAEVDLTPNTPAIVQDQVPVIDPITPQPQIIYIQPNPTKPSQSAVLLPVTGGCSDPYTVQSGDTLSQIAVACNTTLAVLTQVNPQMVNVDCIYPGQQINIHNGNTVQPLATCRKALTPREAPTPREVLTPIVALPKACACYTAPIPVSGLSPMLIPGTKVQVKALNFPPSVPVNVAIGPQTGGYTLITSGVTDASGNLTAEITVPTATDSQMPWAVVVLTTNSSPIQVISRPFYIHQ